MSFPTTRNLDGSLIEVPHIHAESVSSNWQAPADINELLNRAYPNGAPGTWARFFAGEDVTREERDKIRAALRGYANQPESGSQGGQLIRTRSYIERDLLAYAWINNDPHAIINKSPRELGAALSEKAACELKLKTVNDLIEQSAAAIRARVSHESNMHLLFILADAIVNAPASFSDQYKYLLPPATVEAIERRRRQSARQAEEARRAEEASLLRQIEERELAKLELLAAVESYSLNDLLDFFLGGEREEPIRDGLRNRTLKVNQFETLVGLKAAMNEPIARRGLERLAEIGAAILGEIALKPAPTEAEIEAARLANLQAEEEAKQREIAATIKWLEEAQYSTLCAQVIDRNLIPGEHQTGLANVRDITRVTQYRQHFIDRAPLESDPVNRRICELMAQRIGGQQAPVTGAFLGFRG